MKILTAVIIILLTFTLLYSDQTDDLKFIIGLYKDNNFRLAKTELLKFKDNYPESRYLHDVNFLLANIYLKSQQFETAQELYEDLFDNSAVDINRPDIMLGLAQSKFFQNDYIGSAILLNTYLTDYPDHELNWNAYYFLGRIAVEQKELSSASHYYVQALEIKDDVQINIAQMELLLLIDNYTEAKEILLKLLAEHSGKPITDQALIKLHNYNLQVRNFDEILTLGYNYVALDSPYYDDYKLILGITRYEMENYQMALTDLAELDSERANYYKALCYVELNEAVKAVDLFSSTQNSENIEISSNSFFYLARLTVDNETSISMLSEFVETYPNHIFLDAAYYQLGFNYFQIGNYIDAKQNLAKAVELDIADDSREKSIYLIAESEYLLDNKYQAYEEYTEYLTLYPQGSFSDEALFKIGLYLFDQANFPEAFINFNSVIDEFPDSPKVGMSRFYIGEMFFDQNKYFDAERHFEKAKEGIVDLGLVELRLAQIKFYLREYDEAENCLQNIPDLDRYQFDKLILSGNLFFTRKNYDEALKAYDGALAYAPSEQTKQKVLNRKAWTLYQMKDYSKAAEIYRSLSTGDGGSPDYLLKAASSAFSAQNYTSAVELYDEFLAKYSDSNLKIQAQIGLANSYYNKGDFIQSALYYRELLIPENDPEIVENSLNGLRWSCEQDDSIEFLGIVNDILQQYDDVDFETIMLKDKIFYLNSKGMWKELLLAFEEFNPTVAANLESSYIQLYRARASHELGSLEEAEYVFNGIDPEFRDAEVYAAWAELKLTQNDEIGAIDKLRSASQKTRDYNVWLKLLELEQKNDHEMFLNDYNKFGEFAGLQEKQQAQIFWIKWKIFKNELSGLDSPIAELSQSKYTTVKAGSQFLKGYILYSRGEYDNAIPELLRVRYLYPEIGEVRIESEYYACLSYIAAERMNEAEELFELIKTEITPEMKQEIEAGLQGDE